MKLSEALRACVRVWRLSFCKYADAQVITATMETLKKNQCLLMKLAFCQLWFINTVSCQVRPTGVYKHTWRLVRPERFHSVHLLLKRRSYGYSFAVIGWWMAGRGLFCDIANKLAGSWIILLFYGQWPESFRLWGWQTRSWALLPAHKSLLSSSF